MIYDELKKADGANSTEVEVKDEVHENKRHQKTIKETFENWINTTAMHGVGHVYSGHSIHRRIMWFLLIIASSGFLVYQLSQLIISFQKYTTHVVVDTDVKLFVRLPTVTMCRCDGIPISAFRKYPDIEEHFQPFLRNDESYMATRKDLKFQPKITDRHTNRILFAYLYAQLSREQKSRIETASHFVIVCRIIDKVCEERNVTLKHFYSVEYGICFTFNAEDKWMTRVTGESKSLGLILKFNESDSIATLGSTVGINVIIHSANHVPFPDKEGFVVVPGTNAYVGLRLTEELRAKHPHGNCSDSTDVKVLSESIKKSRAFPRAKYTQEVCLRNCLQYHVIKKCQCFDPLLWMPSYFEDKFKTQPCNTINMSECFQNYRNNLTQFKIECNSICPIECARSHYHALASVGTWPSYNYYKYYLRHYLTEEFPDFNQTLSHINDTHKELHLVRSNLIHIHIYMSSLEVTYKTQTPIYNWNRLISDFGGQVGLWLGLSLMAVFELIELLMNISYLLLSRLCRFQKK